jgi:hypothetical protein
MLGGVPEDGENVGHTRLVENRWVGWLLTDSVEVPEADEYSVFSAVVSGGVSSTIGSLIAGGSGPNPCRIR